MQLCSNVNHWPCALIILLNGIFILLDLEESDNGAKYNTIVLNCFKLLNLSVLLKFLNTVFYKSTAC